MLLLVVVRADLARVLDADRPTLLVLQGELGTLPTVLAVARLLAPDPATRRVLRV